MAQITYCTFKEWGIDSFCIQDYAGYVNYHRQSNRSIPKVTDDEIFAGLILFDDDTDETIRSFIRLCGDAKPSIICIELCNLTNPDWRSYIAAMIDMIMHKFGIVYYDLHSYENRLSYGLPVAARG